MYEEKPKELRRAFAIAIAARTSREEMMRTLGIAQATYYQWKTRLSKYGDLWVRGEPITRAIRISGLTVELTQKNIVELSLLNPNLGPKELALDLVSNYKFKAVSQSTVHNILSKHGMGTRTLRAAELRQRFLKGQALTPLQERLVEKKYPLTRWKSKIGQSAGNILTQDVIQLHRLNPLGDVSISIVVDTFDGTAFACFMDKPSKVELAEACAQIAIDSLTQKGHSIRYMYTDTGHEFGGKKPEHSYKILLKTNKITHRAIDQSDNRRNPYAELVWLELKQFLFDGGVPDISSYKGRSHHLNPLIQEFLGKNLGHQYPGVW